MKKILIVTLAILTLLSTIPAQAKDYITPAQTPTPLPWVEDDTFIPGGQVPDWVTVCKDSPVYGNPYRLDKPFYFVRVGDVVRVHDTSQDNTWVMIESARWIPMSAVCDW